MKASEVSSRLREWAGDLKDLEERLAGRDPRERAFWQTHPRLANEYRVMHHTLRTAADMIDAGARKEAANG